MDDTDLSCRLGGRFARFAHHVLAHCETRVSRCVGATVVIAVLMIGVAGCQGSNPFGRFAKKTNDVEITSQSEMGLPEVEAPPQRLAGAKTNMLTQRRVRRPGSKKELLAQAETEVTVTVESKPTKPRSARQSPNSRRRKNAIAMTSLTKQQRQSKNGRSSQSKDVPNAQDTRVAKRTLQRDTVATKHRKASPSDSDVVRSKRPTEAVRQEQELFEALADYPPEVRQEALRRLLASTAKRAKKTDRPKGFQEALEDNLQHLPELPEGSGHPAMKPAIRLVTDLPSSQNPAPNSASKKVAKGTIAAKNSPAENSTITKTDPPAEASGFVGDQPPAKAMAAKKTESKPATPKATVKTVSASQAKEPSEAEVAQAAPTGATTDTSAVKPASSLARDPGKLEDRQLYKALVKRLSKPSPGESDADRASRLIKLRYLTVLSGDVDSAVEKIEGMGEAEQEFLRHQLLGLWTMVDPSGHPVASRRITTALPQFREAAKFAGAATDSLELRSLAFCTEIESYGQIKPFPGNRFDAGQQVILYCEIENFTAKRSGEGFETHLQGSYDIFDENNKKVVTQLLPADKQLSANYLRDYFIAYQMHLPKQLAPGTYRLQLTMEDVQGKKYGQVSIPLEIAK